MKYSKRIMITMLLMLFMLAGCSLNNPTLLEDSQDDMLELEAAVEATIQAKDETSQPIQIPALLPGALDGLSSYRLEVAVNWIRSVPLTNEGSSQGYILRQEVTRQPGARRVYQMISPGIEDWWIEATSGIWNCFDPELNTCTKYETAGYPLNHPLLTGIESILVEAARDTFSIIGEETLAGLTTQHFRIEYVPLAEAVHWDHEHIDTIQNVSGDIWVVNQTGMPFFVIKAIIQWEGFMDGSDGKGVYEYKVSDVNADFTIPLPLD